MQGPKNLFSPTALFKAGGMQKFVTLRSARIVTTPFSWRGMTGVPARSPSSHTCQLAAAGVNETARNQIVEAAESIEALVYGDNGYANFDHEHLLACELHHPRSLDTDRPCPELTTIAPKRDGRSFPQHPPAGVRGEQFSGVGRRRKQTPNLKPDESCREGERQQCR